MKLIFLVKAEKIDLYINIFLLGFFLYFYLFILELKSGF